MQDFIRIHENDNVMVALRDIAAGEGVDISGVRLRHWSRFPQAIRWQSAISLRVGRSSSMVIPSGIPRMP